MWLFFSLTIMAIFLAGVSIVVKKKSFSKLKQPLKPPATSLPFFNPQKEAIDDPMTGQKIKEIYQQKPWLKKLPIEKKTYVISYNWEKQAIRVRLIINADDKLSYNDQVKKIKSAVEQKLKNIGVNLTEIKVYYIFGR